MKRAITLLVLVSCTTRSSDIDPPPGDDPPSHEFPNACPVQACETGSVVTRADDLVTMINGTTEWLAVSEYSTGCRPASKDVPVTGTITVRGDALAMPAACPYCNPQIFFRLRDQVPGVECVEPEYWFDFMVCRAITVTDTTLRLRTTIFDTHPSEYNYAAIVEVLDSCAAPCAAFTCAASHTCWSTARDYCAFCLAGTNEECACYTETNNFAADGASCSYYISGDLIELGACQAGTCMRD